VIAKTTLTEIEQTPIPNPRIEQQQLLFGLFAMLLFLPNQAKETAAQAGF
jgi:hypothetical protein